MRVQGTCFRRGDSLIIEPGAHPSPARLVVCRSEKGLTLRFVAGSGGELLLVSPDLQRLPLGDLPLRAIAGTVIAAIRETGRTVQVATAPRYRFPSLASDDSGDVEPFDLDRERSANAQMLDALLEVLERETRDTPAPPQIVSAVFRLRALHGCLDAVEDPRLYRALAKEVNAVLLRLRRAALIHSRWAPLLRPLAPLSRHEPGSQVRLSCVPRNRENRDSKALGQD